jgi:ATP-dependent Lon protease
MGKGKKKKVKITAKNMDDFLGVPKYRYGMAELEDQVGVVTGLAWTEVGGELLTIEAVMMPGKGKMTVTGNLRDVMKESISAASSYVRSRSTDIGVEAADFRQEGHPRPRARRRHAEGWSVGRYRHGHGHHVSC